MERGTCGRINDEIAVGVIRALSEARVRVSEDMAVAGFDDSEFSGYAAACLPNPFRRNHETDSLRARRNGQPESYVH